MRTIPAYLIPEVYAVNSQNPWLHLLDITFDTTPSPTVYHFCRDTQANTFNGTLYTPFPFDPKVVKETSKGQTPTRQILVSNVLRILESEIETLGGAVASTVVWTLVNYKNLSSAGGTDYADLQQQYAIMATSADINWVYFTLGAPALSQQRFPLQMYDANWCQHLQWFAVSGMECNYSGALTSCLGTYADCQAHNNIVNFGGCPGLTTANTVVSG